MYDFPLMVPLNQDKSRPSQYLLHALSHFPTTKTVSFRKINLNHMRSYSQSCFDYEGSELQMTINDHRHADELRVSKVKVDGW
jgi:hypothetical protein